MNLRNRGRQSGTSKSNITFLIGKPLNKRIYTCVHIHNIFSWNTHGRAVFVSFVTVTMREQGPPFFYLVSVTITVVYTIVNNVSNLVIGQKKSEEYKRSPLPWQEGGWNKVPANLVIY